MATKVIKADGSNKFLGVGSDEGLHAALSKDFSKIDNRMCQSNKLKVESPRGK